MSYHFPRLAISEGILLNLAMDCFGPSLDFLVFNVGFYNCFCPHVTTLSCISQNKKKADALKWCISSFLCLALSCKTDF